MCEGDTFPDTLEQLEAPPPPSRIRPVATAARAVSAKRLKVSENNGAVEVAMEPVTLESLMHMMSNLATKDDVQDFTKKVDAIDGKVDQMAQRQSTMETKNEALENDVKRLKMGCGGAEVQVRLVPMRQLR